MKRSEYRIALDLSGSHGACRLDMKRSDTFRRIYIHITDGGKPYYVSNHCSAVFLARKPSGGLIYNVCNIRDGAVEYDITPQTTAEPGTMRCEVRLYDTQVTFSTDSHGRLYLPEEDAHLITSCTFIIHVHDTVYGENHRIDSRTELTMLDQLVTSAMAAIQDAQSVRQASEAGEFNGISVAHFWNGTELVVSSAAGTSSADLVGPAGPRGEKGDKGDKGDRGEPGYLVDDLIASENPWSSNRILKTICPEFFCDGWLIKCHPVAGDRMDMESTNEEGIITVTGCGKNLYDIKTYDLNTEGYISASNGNTSNSSTYRRTDYIPVSHLRGLTVNLNCAPVDSVLPGMAFYDADKQYISGGKGNAITVPQDACYMRFSVHVDSLARVQLELGTETTDYEPYRGQTWQIDTDEKGHLFTVVPGWGMCHFFAYQNERAVYLLAWGRSDPLPLLRKMAKEENYA